MTKKSTYRLTSTPPARDTLPLIHASPAVEHWLDHYWRKLNIPEEHLRFLAVTESRREFAEWTGRRLNSMALGCYCYLPLGGSPAETDHSVAPGVVEVATETRTASVPAMSSLQPALPGFFDEEPADGADMGNDLPPRFTEDFRHLIFIEPGMLELGIEVTVAHELIHLADRVRGTPRKHRCHGHDSISVDEALITGRDPEMLRAQLAEETKRREEALRQVRPYRYYYYCEHCHRVYPRVRRYTRLVSCGHCCKQYNPEYLLKLRLSPDGSDGTIDAGLEELLDTPIAEDALRDDEGDDTLTA